MRLRSWLNSPDWLKMKNSDATGGEEGGRRLVGEAGRPASGRRTGFAETSAAMACGTHFWARSGQPSAIGKVARPVRLLNVVRFDHHLLGIAIDPHRDVCSEHDVQ